MRNSYRSAVLCTALSLVSSPLVAHAQPATVEVSFDASMLETPEGLAFDHRGNLFISLALTGEIRKIAPDGTQSTHALLPLGAPPLTPCGAFIGIMGAIATDAHGNVFASLASCDDAKRGVWKVTPSGQASLIGPLPPEALPNGIATRHGRVYVADSELGLIWRVDAGGGLPEIWFSHPALVPPPGHVFPGPNGLQFFRGELYVSSPAAWKVFAIEVDGDDAAGALRVHAHNACDDFDFDVHGNLYCTTDPFNTLERIAPDGQATVLLTAADGLDGPTAAHFGRTEGDRLALYVTNAAFPFFSTTHNPTLMRVELGVPGMPR
ncbi:MAG: hypothetical protein IT385_10490 [Deltaproteobacteria bacterium]|nr:hypothetical protein [Deltaproteobacteria bacterium]